MAQIFATCTKYIQGYGELDNIRKYVAYIGRKYLVIASSGRIAALKDQLERAFGDGYVLIMEPFGGESTRAEVNKYLAIAEERRIDGVIGLGGGKVHDTAKAVAAEANVPVIIVPTIAASDCAGSSQALLYDEDGRQIVEFIRLQQGPILLVDTKIILEAPVRYLVAGMGDALSTYLGARVAADNYKNNYHGGLYTESSMAVARCCYDILMKYGKQARIAAENHAYSDAFNKIVEANTLMSALGFENNGSGTDHAFWMALLTIPRYTDHALHGEGVAFSSICQLVLEGKENALLDEVYRFCVDVGLPVTWEQLGLYDLTDEELFMAAAALCEKPRNHPFEITPEKVVGTLKNAEAIGKMYLSGGSLL